MNKNLIKFILIIILAIIISIILFIGVQFCFANIVDTKYAIRYAKVLDSYDIREMDEYLNEETLLTYNGVTKSYKELRDNVIHAFEEKKYSMSDSYGHAYGFDRLFLEGISEIGMQVYVEPYCDYYSDYAEMELQCQWLFFYKVKSIKSEDSLFGHIFFGEG